LAALRSTSISAHVAFSFPIIHMTDSEVFFQKYAAGGYLKVEGWAQPGVFPVLAAVNAYQREQGLTGDVGEIGVHHGKFFIALHNCLGGDEMSVAIDIFDDQRLNVDHSGSANLASFIANMEANAWEPQRCHRVKGDSLALRPRDFELALPRPARTRFFSVDGGHTPEHTINDIGIAVSLSHGYGVIFVDDYYNPHWPGVHIGVAKYFETSYPAFVPFGYVRDKLMLTSLTWQKTYFDLMALKFRSQPNFKVVQMFGHRVAVV
jgi:hypothetical protein